MLDVLGFVWAVIEDIIKEHHHKFPKIRLKYIIHQGWEGCGDIGKKKGHY